MPTAPQQILCSYQSYASFSTVTQSSLKFGIWLKSQRECNSSVLQLAVSKRKPRLQLVDHALKLFVVSCRVRSKHKLLCLCAALKV